MSLGALAPARASSNDDDMARIVAQATALLDALRASGRQSQGTEQQLSQQAPVVPLAPSASTTVGGSFGGGAASLQVAASQVAVFQLDAAKPPAQYARPLPGGTTSVGGSISGSAISGGFTTASTVASGGQVPRAFLWDGKYYNLVLNPTSMDVTDGDAVRRRVTLAMVAHMHDEGKLDYAVLNIRLRDVFGSTHADLLAMDPGAKYVAYVTGIDGSGVSSEIPVVFNSDGSVYVDPIIRR